jgi:hypothetical protein
MLMKVFPRGQGEGNKPTRYLVHLDSEGRQEHPPEILRGDIAMTRALIDSITRKWKYTSGALSWHPDDKVTPEQEEKVMDEFERVAFAGLEPDQRYILWVRHTHAGHHELHFVIPRMELSNGKDFNACPPGWQKDFSVFRDLQNRREGWIRPDDPAHARERTPAHADLHNARLLRWGKTPKKDDRADAKDAIHEYLMRLVKQGLVQNREDILRCLREAGMEINRAGKEYITVKDPDSGEKLRLKGGIYAAQWTAKTAEPEPDIDPQERIIRLEADLCRVIETRSLCNSKRYPRKKSDIEPEQLLTLPKMQEALNHDRNGTNAQPDIDEDGTDVQRPTDGIRPAIAEDGGQPDADPGGIARFEAFVQRCKRSVRELADLVGEIEKRRIEREQAQQAMTHAPRMRMR